MNEAKQIVHFRGCDNLVVAPITKDVDEENGYVTGAVIPLAPLGSVSKTTESSSEPIFYDNASALTIMAEGTDEIKLTVPALSLDKLALVTSKTIDSETGVYIDSQPRVKYYALGYREKLTDSTYRYTWRLKGTFSIPEESSNTEDDSTESNGQELTYTGIHTTHRFAKASQDDEGRWVKGTAKGVIADERDKKCDLSAFFDEVTTPDTTKPLTPPTPPEA